MGNPTWKPPLTRPVTVALLLSQVLLAVPMGPGAS
jgi:hypothetical protein